MSLDEPALSAQRAVDRLIRRLRRGAGPVAHPPAAPRGADRRSLTRGARGGARVGEPALSRPPAQASRPPAEADGHRVADVDGGFPTWRRWTGCAPTFRGFITTIGNSAAIPTSRGPDTPR